MEENKKWERPVLTALVRSNPEERILEGCKWEGEGGFTFSHTGCYEDTSGECSECSGITIS